MSTLVMVTFNEANVLLVSRKLHQLEPRIRTFEDVFILTGKRLNPAPGIAAGLRWDDSPVGHVSHVLREEPSAQRTVTNA